MNIQHSCDNVGHRMPAHVNMGDPILASGQLLAAGSKNTNAEITVVAGATYAITSVTGDHVFGLADTATAANVIWACPQGQTIIIKIPIGYTTLHYQTPSDSRSARLRRLKDREGD